MSAIGGERAEFLFKKGKKVTILEMLDRIANDIERSYPWVIMFRIRDCVEPRRLLGALRSGFHMGRTI
jgi:hypothetical protein